MLEHDYRIAPEAERNSAVQKASASGNVEMVSCRSYYFWATANQMNWLLTHSFLTKGQTAAIWP